MLKKLLSLLGGGSSTDFKQLYTDGAVLVDVRTNAEYQSGHIRSAKNMPLQSLNSKLSELKKLNKPIIVCCASGMRSAQATKYLNSNGITAYNGGGWQSLERKLS